MLATAGTAAAEVADPAAALRARYEALAERLARSPFGQPLLLDSEEQPHALVGDVYAIVDHPLGTVASALTRPPEWCEALILHINVKFCRAHAPPMPPGLSVAIGRKVDQPLAEAFQVEFRLTATTARDYLGVSLAADKGPLGTKNYRIDVEGTAVSATRTFLHLRYAYQFGLEGRLALETYLATTGSGKVGFTRVDSGSDPARYVTGLRGAVERNTMRYFLTLDAYLGSRAAPPPQRFEDGLARWYAASERYARQLHELERGDYYAIKRREYARQQSP
ncbi:MAG: hypothetical protein JSR54_04455 [Proteobacteria bacterium]|nr:hypothetical protein [Pseudomonadota bacterium]